MSDPRSLTRSVLTRLVTRHDGDSPALRRDAAQAGLVLRRTRPRGERWWRRDLGLVLGFDALGRPQVLDTPQAPAQPCGDLAYAVRSRGAPPSRTAWAVESTAAAILGLAAQIPAAALHHPKALAALVLAAVAGALAESARRRATARRLGRHSLDAHAGLWDRLMALPPHAVTSQLPESCHHALSLSILAEADDAKRRGHAVLAAALILPAVLHLAWLSPQGLAVAGILALPLAGLRRVALGRARHWRHCADQARPESDKRLSLTATALPELRLLGAAEWLVSRARDQLTTLSALNDRARWWDAIARLSGGAMMVVVPAAAWNGGPASALAALALAQGAALLPRALDRARPPTTVTTLLATTPEQIHAMPAPERIHGLELDQVSHTYAGAPRPALTPVSLRVLAGQMVAVAGPSGAGKSTLLRLALGLAEPTQGVVRVNGHPLDHWDRAACRRRMAAVLQDEEVGIDTIRAVVLGMAPLPAEAAWDALRLAGLEQDIAALPMGIQTLVSEGGFPAGLLQRLLIARALARSPDILVLDEATTALDTGLQADLFATLKARGTAILVASHRPETLALADHVVELAPA